MLLHWPLCWLCYKKVSQFPSPTPSPAHLFHVIYPHLYQLVKKSFCKGWGGWGGDKRQRRDTSYEGLMSSKLDMVHMVRERRGGGGGGGGGGDEGVKDGEMKGLRMGEVKGWRMGR